MLRKNFFVLTMILASLLGFTACGSTNDKLSQPSEISELSTEHSENIEQSIVSEKNELSATLPESTESLENSEVSLEKSEISIENSEIKDESKISSEETSICTEISKEPKSQNNAEIKLTYDKICSMIKEESNGLKITMKIWANDLENREKIRHTIKKFESDYSIDGVEYDIYVVVKRENKAMDAILEAPIKGAAVTFIPFEQLESGVNQENPVLAEVLKGFDTVIQNNSSKAAIEKCMYKDKLYAYPVKSDENRLVVINSTTRYPITASMCALYLSEMELSE